MDKVDVLQIKIDEAKSKLPEETISAIAAVDWRAAILKLRETKGYSFEQLGDLETETELLLCGLVGGKEYAKEIERRMGISRAQVDELVSELNESIFRKIREELIKITENKKIFGKKESVPVMPTPRQPAPKIITPKPRNDSNAFVDAGIEIVDRFAAKNPAGADAHPRSWYGEEKSQGETIGRKEILPAPEKPELRPSATPPPNLPISTPPVINIPRPAVTPAPKETPHPLLNQKFGGYVQNNVVETQHTANNLIKNNVVGSSLPKPPSAPKAVSYPKNADPYRLPPE